MRDSVTTQDIIIKFSTYGELLICRLPDYIRALGHFTSRARNKSEQCAQMMSNNVRHALCSRSHIAQAIWHYSVSVVVVLQMQLQVV